MRVCIAALAPDTGRLSFFNIVFSWLFISVFTLADTTSGLRAPAEAISDGASVSEVLSKYSFLASEGDGSDPVWTCRRKNSQINLSFNSCRVANNAKNIRLTSGKFPLSAFLIIDYTLNKLFRTKQSSTNVYYKYRSFSTQQL